ncbi:MAG: alpha-mannosidase [Promethearchaeota archaeon]|jgi:mannosylglycerate hydrolase
MKANHIVIVPETHWDREWYIPFQEFRARLVIMMDKLFEILRSNPDYKNFTFDGQTIPIEDYLEVRPEMEEEIRKYVKQGRLSIGPMYVLPDEFLVSGESIIRNLLIGHQISRKFGRVMKTGYIPDPFGHIAQLPQIIQGFEIPSVLFWRGFGNEYEENNLNMEFIWNAPGMAASLLAIHLVFSYGSLERLNTTKVKGEYRKAMRSINYMVKKFEDHIATPNILLNNGSDHHEALAEIPEIVKQWNEIYPDQNMVQADFEYYIKKVLESNPKLKQFQGELRGGRYAPLLSGVFSARMWIKQRNTAIEYLYEKYAEPLSLITNIFDTSNQFLYPDHYLRTGMKWLQKNAPHDSICGCSIDEVHNEMITRYDWAEQIANEILKDSFLYLASLIKFSSIYKDKSVLIVYNPLPWTRRDVVEFITSSRKAKGGNRPGDIEIIDTDETKIPFQSTVINDTPRFTRKFGINHRVSFIAEVPGCGYRVYYVLPSKDEMGKIVEAQNFKITRDYLENEYYNVKIGSDGSISVLDKKTGKTYERVCEFEDVGDWGDEYDYSGPKENQTDLIFRTEDTAVLERNVDIDGPTQKTYKLRMNLKLPYSLTEDRYNREDWLVDNKISMYISLYKGIRRIDFKIEIDNNSKDHRIRALFPTEITSDRVFADGHFYVVPRKIALPKAENWVQKPLPTNHQKDFISISDESNTYAILNKGLPEYEAIVNDDKNITLAITLLRCNEWLSRDDFQSRKSHAGPGFKTPGAQCLGNSSFELSMITNNESNWLDSKVHLRGKEFNNPLKPVFPSMIQSPLRTADRVILRPSGVLSYFYKTQQRISKEFLPTVLSFLEIDNDSIALSCLKKSEIGDSLIVRIFNISSGIQKAKLTFYEKISLRNVEIVNFLEETPINEIKAKIHNFEKNVLEVTIDPHVIATFKINLTVIE